VYKPREIAGIREACRIGREVLDIAGRDGGREGGSVMGGREEGRESESKGQGT
jgi:hypothetical protein